MKITVFYDYICPFSYIGSKRIQKIANEYGFEIDWKGYEIHPEYPKEGKKRKRTLKTIRVLESLNSVLDEGDVDIKLPGFITNSRLALLTAEFAKSKDKFIEFHNLCYDSYFLEGKNIGDINVILEIAEKVDLDKSELDVALENKKTFETLKNYRTEAEEFDVLGVPSIVFNSFRVHGVQTIETYRQIIAKFLN